MLFVLSGRGGGGTLKPLVFFRFHLKISDKNKFKQATLQEI